MLTKSYVLTANILLIYLFSSTINRYNILLLYFIGVTCLDISFSSAFYFIAIENKVIYRYAIIDFK